jgi:uncharacterized lipoprotein YmbA
MLAMHVSRFIYYLALSCCFLSLTGCIGGSTPPAQFYLLEPLGADGGTPATEGIKPVVSLGPVRIPRYVDRPQIVTASGRNAYRLSEMNQWAESLDDNISRVLAQNLSRLASVDTVLSNSSNRARQAQLRVAVNILEFHVNPAGQAGLTAQWQILRGGDAAVTRLASYRAPASTTDYRAMVMGLNECLNQMSRELAGGVRQALAEGKKTGANP